MLSACTRHPWTTHTTKPKTPSVCRYTSLRCICTCCLIVVQLFVRLCWCLERSTHVASATTSSIRRLRVMSSVNHTKSSFSHMHITKLLLESTMPITNATTIPKSTAKNRSGTTHGCKIFTRHTRHMLSHKSIHIRCVHAMSLSVSHFWNMHIL